jgi:hypothetical protein
MTVTAHAGPLVVGFTEQLGGAATNINPEQGPSLLPAIGILDPRLFYGYNPGQNFGSVVAGWPGISRPTTINAIPMTLSSTIIAAAAHTTGGTAMTLASSSVDGLAVGVSITRADTGIVVSNLLKLDPAVASVVATIALSSNIMTVTAVNAPGGHCYNQLCPGMVLKDTTNAGYLPTGTYITGGAWNGLGTGFGGLGTYTLSASATTAISGDTLTGLFTNTNTTPYSTIPFGSAGSVQLWNPQDMISRAVKIVSTTSQVVQTFTVNGLDVYGYPMTEVITLVGTSATTTNGKKAFKYISSVTPSVTDGTGSYSVGTQDIIGYPLRTDNFTVGAEFDLTMMWNTALVAATTGYVAAVLTTPTNATGDVRGTWALTGAASNGTLRYIVAQRPQPAQFGQAALLGNTQFTAW